MRRKGKPFERADLEGSGKVSLNVFFRRVAFRDGCAAAAAQAQDACVNLVFTHIAWVASVDVAIKAIRW